MQNCWIMGKTHLNKVRQTAYQGVAVGAGLPLQQRQAVGDLWHSNHTALHGHGGSGRGIKLWIYSCWPDGHSDGTVLTGVGVSVCH